MKALCWHGKHDIRYDTVPDPTIEHPRDAIVKMTSCAICGSDLHFFDGFVLREMMYVCRPAGTLSVAGVYGGLVDNIPFGAVMNKGLTIKTGPTHVNRWTEDLLERIADGQIDPSFVITHTVGLDEGPAVQDFSRQGGWLHQGRHEAMISMNQNPVNGAGAESNAPAQGAHTHPLSKVLPTRPLGPMRAPARALGWFSIGLGLLELSMPRKLARAAGAPDLPGVVRAYGMREIATGVGLLTSKDPSPWLWARVAGDALDIATVGAGMLTAGRPLRTLGAVAMLLGVAWLDAKVAEAAPLAKKRARSSGRNYSSRSGFPVPATQMRGVGKKPSMKMDGANGASSDGEFRTGTLAYGPATRNQPAHSR